MAYEQILGTAMLGVVVTGIKIWRDSSRTKELAEKNSRDIDEHKKECNGRHEANARIVEKVESMEKDIDSINREMRWNGDCMITLGAAMSVKLPERPR